MSKELTPENLLELATSGNVEEVMEENPAPRDTVWDRPMCQAILQNNIVAIQTLVSAGADINRLGLITPLHLALSSPGYSCVAGLIKLGVDVNIVDREGKTVLMDAAKKLRDTYCIQLLVKAGADLNLRQVKHYQGGSFGPTALMFAALNQKVDSLKLLLKAGADVNVKTSDGKTALMFAAQGKDETFLKLLDLLEAGADVNVKTTDGKTALMFAADTGGIKCLKLLLEAGADVNVKTVDGVTALHYACKGLKLSSCSETVEGVKILIDSGSNVQTTDTKGQTVLMYAVRNSWNVNLLSVLVEAGVVIGQQDFCGRTALAHAVSWGSHKCVCWLIDHGASVDICDFSGKTLLHYLMSDSDNDSNAMQCFAILIRKQLDVNATDKDGMTPLMYVARMSKEGTATIDRLLKHGADLNLVDNQGQTALIHSLRLERSELDERKPSCHRVQPTVNFVFLLYEGANVRVGKIASGQLSRLARLNTDLDLLMLQVGSTVDLKATWEQFAEVFANNKRGMLQFLIINGVMPSRPHKCLTWPITSLLESPANRASYGMVKYLIAVCFLHADDVKVMNNLRSQPWPLVKLCFVTVSTALGASPGRQERVKNSQLPPKLQRMLLFQEPSSRLCVHQWDKITLTFSPEEYEKLPRPRPLLYHWPVGRALVTCDCGECDGTMYKYEGDEEDV